MRNILALQTVERDLDQSCRYQSCISDYSVVSCVSDVSRVGKLI